LANESPLVHQAAAESIGKLLLFSPDAVRKLELLQRDTDPFVGWQAGWSLWRLRGI
jgi:hypothetical protein